MQTIIPAGRIGGGGLPLVWKRDGLLGALRCARAAGLRRPALLYSATPVTPWTEKSIFAAEPLYTIEARGERIVLNDWRARRIEIREEPLQFLTAALNSFRRADGAAPAQGVWFIGYLAYEAGRWLDRMPVRDAAAYDVPDFAFHVYPWALEWHRRTLQLDLLRADCHSPLLQEIFGLQPAEAREQSAEVLERLRASGRLPFPSRRNPPGVPSELPDELSARWRAVISRQEYLAKAGKILDYIRAGDVYQANLTFQLRRDAAPDAADVFFRAARLNPAQNAAWLDFGEFQIVSASPELFLKTFPRSGGDMSIVTRPIKGTRPRGADPAVNAQMAAELRASAKERAEHVMIVDLERNDLGRICRYGSVRVSELLALEELPNLYHLTSTVEGVLKPGIDTREILRATFPGGSISGAPKIRALEILAELETQRRGVYTGAIGLLRPGGEINLSIAIRTLLFTRGAIRLGVGSGIVADSDPAREWDECLEKGRRLAAIADQAG